MGTTGIIDVSKGDIGNIDQISHRMQAAASKGVFCCLAKASEGKDFVDRSFVPFMVEARKQNMLRAGFHYISDTESGDLQADWFLESCGWQEDPEMRLCCDFEPDTDHAPTATPDDVRAFRDRVADRTGYYPILYGSTSFLRNKFPDPKDRMGTCPLWPAQYSEPGVLRLPPAWKEWLFWQYTDGKYGPSDTTLWPKITPGFGTIDRNYYPGSETDLRALWPTLGKVPVTT